VLRRSSEDKHSGEAGFSLIELLVVIVILGILAAIAVFAVGGINEKGQESADKTTCSVLETAEEAYFASHTPHHYAADQDTLKTDKFLRTTDDDFTITVDAGPPESFTVTGPNCP
jgi:general secretion pathway protein G